METTFTIRPYGKTELAQAYTHGSMSARCSLNWLNRELNNYPGLMEQLEALGYHPGIKTFTIAQLRLIIAAIGMP